MFTESLAKSLVSENFLWKDFHQNWEQEFIYCHRADAIELGMEHQLSIYQLPPNLCTYLLEQTMIREL